MKAWLKYGLIFLVAFALISLISIPTSLIGIAVPINFVGLMVVTIFGYNIENSSSFGGYGVAMLIISAAFWFIVGALIGWIVSKVRGGKK
jgi:predicted cobalt transporter CbtA